MTRSTKGDGCSCLLNWLPRSTMANCKNTVEWITSKAEGNSRKIRSQRIHISDWREGSSIYKVCNVEDLENVTKRAASDHSPERSRLTSKKPVLSTASKDAAATTSCSLSPQYEHEVFIPSRTNRSESYSPGLHISFFRHLSQASIPKGSRESAILSCGSMLDHITAKQIIFRQ